MASTPDSLGWNTSVWDTIKQTVHDETQRTKIGQKILPLNGPLPDMMNVPSDITEVSDGGLTVTEGASTSLIETTVQFAMTKTQVNSQEEQLSTALTLATRAANLISIAQDQLIFQGSVKLPENLVQARLNSNNGKGLLSEGDKDIKSIEVRPVGREGSKAKYGVNTFAAVVDGIASLQRDGHYGPYALVLHTDIYADTYAPLEDTLIMPADRIKPLVEKGFYGTGALPEKRALLLSQGGNTMDLTIGVDTTPEFMFLDNTGMYRFRVFERFALRLKNKQAVRRLVFKEKEQ
jgi:uncharacterized linocin/CFP29 family protein